MIQPSKRVRILCLHGKCQNGAMFSDKISGVRRKLKKMYDLIFIDAPLNVTGEEPHSLAWWMREEDNQLTSSSIQRAFEYVKNHSLVQGETIDILLGFSQGGTLATALAVSGCLTGVQAVITAGAPYVPEALEVAHDMAKQSSLDHSVDTLTMHPKGLNIPKLHLAGITDTLVPLESTRKLSEYGGQGRVILHEQGHLFPTRSAPVAEIMDFLQRTIYS